MVSTPEQQPLRWPERALRKALREFVSLRPPRLPPQKILEESVSLLI